jgi:hypothetical protein
VPDRICGEPHKEQSDKEADDIRRMKSLFVHEGIEFIQGK